MNLKCSKHHDFFNKSSLGHIYFGFILTQFLKHYTNSKMKNIFLGTFIHGFEDYMENHGTSVEGMFSYIINCSKKGFLETRDNDSLQNFIGDVTSHLIGALIAFNVDRFNMNKIIILFFIQVLFYIIFCKMKT